MAKPFRKSARLNRLAEKKDQQELIDAADHAYRHYGDLDDGFHGSGAEEQHEAFVDGVKLCAKAKRKRADIFEVEVEGGDGSAYFLGSLSQVKARIEKLPDAEDEEEDEEEEE